MTGQQLSDRCNDLFVNKHYLSKTLDKHVTLLGHLSLVCMPGCIGKKERNIQMPYTATSFNNQSFKLQPTIFPLSQYVSRFHKLPADTMQRFLQLGSAYILYNATRILCLKYYIFILKLNGV